MSACSFHLSRSSGLIGSTRCFVGSAGVKTPLYLYYVCDSAAGGVSGRVGATKDGAGASHSGDARLSHGAHGLYTDVLLR